MRTKNVVGVLENLKRDKCGYEITAINQAIDCVKQINEMSRFFKRYRALEQTEEGEFVNTIDNPLGFNPYQE